MKSYSTARYDVLVEELYGEMKNTIVLNPHPGLIIATHCFRTPYPLINQNMQLSLSTMDLLILYAYPYQFGYAKFTILLTMMKSYGANVTFTIGNAIPLTLVDGEFIPKSEIFAHIMASLLKYIELYEGDVVSRITIHVYSVDKKMTYNSLSINERKTLLNELLNNFDSSTSIKNLTAKKIKNMLQTISHH